MAGNSSTRCIICLTLHRAREHRLCIVLHRKRHATAHHPRHVRRTTKSNDHFPTRPHAATPVTRSWLRGVALRRADQQTNNSTIHLRRSASQPSMPLDATRPLWASATRRLRTRGRLSLLSERRHEKGLCAAVHVPCVGGARALRARPFDAPRRPRRG